MQSTASNESSGQARLDSGAQPATEAQIEEYVRGFSAALNQLYQQRGVPAAVHARLQSSTSSDLNRPTPGQQSWSGQVISNSDCHRASTTIPLCVTRLESNFSDDQPLDEVQQQQPQQQSTNCRVNSTGMDSVTCRSLSVCLAVVLIGRTTERLARLSLRLSVCPVYVLLIRTQRCRKTKIGVRIEQPAGQF